MIPLVTFNAVVTLLGEALKAWNALKPEQRDEIVKRWLEDDAKRRSDWERFKSWLGGLFSKISW